MATKTDQELLDAARNGLYDIIVNGQEIVYEGRRFSKLNASELMKIIKELETRVRNTSSGSILDRTFTGIPCRGA